MNQSHAGNAVSSIQRCRPFQLSDIHRHRLALRRLSPVHLKTASGKNR